jgi:hypothetical protein
MFFHVGSLPGRITANSGQLEVRKVGLPPLFAALIAVGHECRSCFKALFVIMEVFTLRDARD